VLEGIFRETVANTDQRLIVAFISFLFWTLYFVFVGRVRRSSQAAGSGVPQ
jgi:uncharacterized membrane protein